MRKVAVTGANGYIGRPLCADLSADHDIVPVEVSGVEKPVDVADLDALREAIAGCDTVIHLARAGKGKVVSWEDTQANLDGTYNVYEAARQAGCERVIFGSSNHAVGMYEVLEAPGLYEPKNGTLIGVDAARPSGLYGVWKVFGEVLGRYYSDEFGLKVASIRISVPHVYGEDLKNLANGLNLTDRQKRNRNASMYVSHRNIAGLVRAIMASDVPFGVVYAGAEGDNPARFYDLEAGRTLYGFWPKDSLPNHSAQG